MQVASVATGLVMLTVRPVGTNSYTTYIAKGITTSTVTIEEGLTANTTYEIRMVWLSNQSLDLYAGGPFSESEVLIPATNLGSDWADNLSFAGKGKARPPITSTTTGSTGSNQVPVFDPVTPLTLHVRENTTGTIGDPVTAGDPDDDSLAYSLTGLNSGAFTIDPMTAQLSVGANTVVDYETKDSYFFIVIADDDDAQASRLVTVVVEDLLEPPPAPAGPTVTPLTPPSRTSLTVTWTAPDTTGRPDVTDYDVRYREEGGTEWADHPFTGTGLTTNLTTLSPGTTYEVQAPASNADGPSQWSDSGRGAADNQSPTFTDTTRLDLTVAENTTGNIGTLVDASDPDNESVTYRLEGRDAATFAIDLDSGQLSVAIDATLDYETQIEHNFQIVASDGHPVNGTATRDVQVTVTDVLEPPAAPFAPSVDTLSSTALQVNWQAPSTTGPPIDDYDVQYRKVEATEWTTHLFDGDATATKLTGLTVNTNYEVQVQAKNTEGASPWSDSGGGRTSALPPREAGPSQKLGLAITVDSSEPVPVGGMLDYRLTITNLGDIELTGVTWREIAFAGAPQAIGRMAEGASVEVPGSFGPVQAFHLPRIILTFAVDSKETDERIESCVVALLSADPGMPGDPILPGDTTSGASPFVSRLAASTLSIKVVRSRFDVPDVHLAHNIPDLELTLTDGSKVNCDFLAHYDGTGSLRPFAALPPQPLPLVHVQAAASRSSSLMVRPSSRIICLTCSVISGGRDKVMVLDFLGVDTHRVEMDRTHDAKSSCTLHTMRPLQSEMVLF